MTAKIKKIRQIWTENAYIFRVVCQIMGIKHYRHRFKADTAFANGVKEECK